MFPQIVKKAQLIGAAFKSPHFSCQLFLFAFEIVGSGTENCQKKIISMAQLFFNYQGNILTD